MRQNSQKLTTEEAEKRQKAGLHLFYAARSGNVALVRELAPVADVSVKVAGGMSALHGAVEARSAECIEALLPWIDANTKSLDTRTSLMDAAAYGWAEGVQLLLAASDASLTNRVGVTALMFAAGVEGAQECIRLLLPRCDPNAKDRRGQSPLSWAATTSLENVCALLPACNPRTQDHSGYTPLMLAATVGRQLSVVEALIPGSDLWAMDKAGRTALDHALKNPNKGDCAKIADLIRQSMAIAERADLRKEVALSENGGEGRAGEAAESQGQEARAGRRPPKSL